MGSAGDGQESFVILTIWNNTLCVVIGEEEDEEDVE